MGGNLFPTARRHTTDELTPITHNIMQLCERFNVKASTIRFLADKQDHGDLDIMVDRQSVSDAFTEHIYEHYDFRVNGKLSDGKTITNTDVLSFLYNELQVDFIFIDSDSFEFATHYHAYNDLGGIIGASIRPMGIVLGREGLYYNYEPIPSTGNRKIYLTKDFFELLDVFGLSRHIYEAGTLRDIDDIIKYVKDWKYFNVDYIDPQQMNATRRNRAAKRSTFTQVSQKCHALGLKSRYHKTDITLDEIIARFDQSCIELQRRHAEEQANKLIERRYALSLARVNDVLGVVDQPQQLLKHFSKRHASAKDVAYGMSDVEFREELLDILKEIE